VLGITVDAIQVDLSILEGNDKLYDAAKVDRLRHYLPTLAEVQAKNFLTKALMRHGMSLTSISLELSACYRKSKVIYGHAERVVYLLSA